MVDYTRSLSDDAAASIAYFKKLTDEDVDVIIAESCFLQEHFTPVTDLIVLLEGRSYLLAHRLYPLLNEVTTSFKVLQNANALGNALGKNTKDAYAKLPRVKRSNLKDRIKEVANLCVEGIPSS